jgi:hypothetical protein
MAVTPEEKFVEVPAKHVNSIKIKAWDPKQVSQPKII